MTPEKVKQYKVTLGLLGMQVNYQDKILLQYKEGKSNTRTYVLAFLDDFIYKVYGGTYVELREEELDEIIQKYASAKGKYDD